MLAYYRTHPSAWKEGYKMNKLTALYNNADYVFTVVTTGWILGVVVVLYVAVLFGTVLRHWWDTP